MVGELQVPSGTIAKSPSANPDGSALYGTPAKFLCAKPYMVDTRSRTWTALGSVSPVCFVHRVRLRSSLSCAVGYSPWTEASMVSPEVSLPLMPSGVTPLLLSVSHSATNWFHVVGTARWYFSKIDLL